MSDGATILLTAVGTGIGVILGAVPSWYFSRWYYLKSGTDLDAALRPLAGDTQKALQALSTVGRMLEQAGIGHPNYDAAGNLTGVVIEASVSDVATVSDAAIVTHTKAPLPQYDRQHEQPLMPEQEDDHA